MQIDIYCRSRYILMKFTGCRSASSINLNCPSDENVDWLLIADSQTVLNQVRPHLAEEHDCWIIGIRSDGMLTWPILTKVDADEDYESLNIATWSMVSMRLSRSMNSRRSAFSASNSPPSRSVGTLTCPMSSRQLKMYLRASLDLIPVSASCSSGVYNPTQSLLAINYINLIIGRTSIIVSNHYLFK